MAAASDERGAGTAAERLPSLEQRLQVRSRPSGSSPAMFQEWRNLLFLHWTWDAGEIQRTLPEGLHVDTHDGVAYLGLVPFEMCNIRPRGLPAVPGISNFLEINLRTYVYDDHGVPGVWFYSLDANQWLAVRVARTFFKLPYFDARMSTASLEQDGDACFDYRTQRRGSDRCSRFLYRGQGTPRESEPGSLEFFLAERYVLFAHNPTRNQLSTGRVHHVPYPLELAHCSDWDESIFELDGFAAPGRSPDLAHFSTGVTVDIFALERAR